MLANITIASAYYSSSGHARAITCDCSTGQYNISADGNGITFNTNLNGFKFRYNYNSSRTTAYVTAPSDCALYYNDTKLADLTADVEYTWTNCPNFGGQAASQTQNIYVLRFL